MSHMSDVYGGRFLKAADLANRPQLFTIERASFEKLPDFNNPTQQNERLILNLIESGKDIAVNATSARVLMSAFGEDESKYAGRKIVAYAVPVNVGGQMKESVMIRLPRQQAAQSPPPAPAPPPVNPTTVGDFDDEIPF